MPDRPPAAAPRRAVGDRVESGFERALWNSRLLMLAAVLLTLVLAVAALLLAAFDTFYVGSLLVDYAGGVPARDTARTDIVAGIIKALDGFLIAALLIIVALGLYELFVSANEPAQDSPAAQRLLHVTSLDDLKARVGKLVVLVLVVEFFQLALRLPIGTAQELLFLGLGTLVVSAALYLTARH